MGAGIQWTGKSSYWLEEVGDGRAERSSTIGDGGQAAILLMPDADGWRRQWQATPVVLPGKSHGWRSLVGYSPWCHHESVATEQLRFHFSLSRNGERNGNPLQCSRLENPRDGRAWWAVVCGVAQSRTRLKRLSSSSSSSRYWWNTHLHLQKLATWTFICRGRTVIVLTFVKHYHVSAVIRDHSCVLSHVFLTEFMGWNSCISLNFKHLIIGLDLTMNNLLRVI